MQIDDQLISRLEKLARLRLSEEERSGIRKDLNQILQMVEKLRQLDTEGVEPLTHMMEEHNVFREDRVQGQLDRETALQNAPKSDGVYFKVPKVIP